MLSSTDCGLRLNMSADSADYTDFISTSTDFPVLESV